MIKPFTDEEEAALREAPETRLTNAQVDEMLRDLQESRRLQSHLSRVERASELAREVRESGAR